MQPIAAAACLGRVEFESEIVPADEPVKGALRMFIPPDVRCGAIGFQTGRDRCLRLNGLLVEIGARAAAAVKPITANGSKVTLLGHLQFRQPAQGQQPPLKYRLLSGCLSAHNQGLRELGVVVRQSLFKPLPVRMRTRFKDLHEPASQCLSGLVDQAVSAQPAQIFMDADQAERPSPRPCEPCQRSQRQREELSRHHMEAAKGRTTPAYAYRPERPPLPCL